MSHLYEAVHLTIQMNRFTRMKAPYQRTLECLRCSFSSVWRIVAYLCTCYEHLYPTSHRDVYRKIIGVNFYTSFAISTINRTYFYNYGFLTQFNFAVKIKTFAASVQFYWCFDIRLHCCFYFFKVNFVMCSFLIPKIIWLVQERFSNIFPMKQYSPPLTIHLGEIPIHD